jgi:uncharacterized membrane protein
MLYVAAAFICGQALPRFELLYLDQNLGISTSSAQAGLSAVASEMMALTALVFALSFIMVQFSAVAYSPRLVHWFIGDRWFYHLIGVYSFTFVFAFFTLAWVDRNGTGVVPEYPPWQLEYCSCSACSSSPGCFGAWPICRSRAYSALSEKKAAR